MRAPSSAAAPDLPSLSQFDELRISTLIPEQLTSTLLREICAAAVSKDGDAYAPATCA